MSKIVRHSDWGHWDQLDGQTLRDGEHLCVTWPDGTPQDVVCAVIDRGIEISDHGNTYRGPGVVAYAAISHHGVAALVPLVGLDAVRIAAESAA